VRANAALAIRDYSSRRAAISLEVPVPIDPSHGISQGELVGFVDGRENHIESIVI